MCLHALLKETVLFPALRSCVSFLPIGKPTTEAAIADVHIWPPGQRHFACPRPFAGLRPFAAHTGLRPFALMGLRPFAHIGLRP